MWKELPEEIRKNLMKYMIARWAAFPQLFWLLVNDIHCDEDCPTSQAFIREAGNYFAGHDPWQHLISVGPNRYADFPFLTGEDMKWVSYIHIEDSQDVEADVLNKYAGYPFHVFNGEDRYEQDRYDLPTTFCIQSAILLQMAFLVMASFRRVGKLLRQMGGYPSIFSGRGHWNIGNLILVCILTMN